MDGAESGSPHKSLRNMMDEISPAKYEGSLTKITQSPGDSGEQTFADKPIGIDSVIKKELDKIERIMVLESRWSGQYTLMPTLKSSPKNTKSQKKFGLLAKQDDEEIKLTKEDTELLLGTLLDLMISPKQVQVPPMQNSRSNSLTGLAFQIGAERNSKSKSKSKSNTNSKHSKSSQGSKKSLKTIKIVKSPSKK